MLKFTDIHHVIQKKISRNNIMFDMIDINQKILDKETDIIQLRNVYYNNQKFIICQLNEIEKLQCCEYTLIRQETITNLSKKIGVNDNEIQIKTVTNEINTLKKDLLNNINNVNHIQSLIPYEGIATNYKYKINIK
jgi:hypothetical protein